MLSLAAGPDHAVWSPASRATGSVAYSWGAMARIEIVDVADEARFALIPPCADPGFDHRSCDYWEDADRGSKASRSSWLPAAGGLPGAIGGPPATPANPFAPPPRTEANPFAPAFGTPARNPLLEDAADRLADNPFAPQRLVRPTVAAEAPRKLQLLGRGLGVFGSYAKLLLADGEAAVYCQFGPLSAYPRALRLRELYPQLPDAPLPAVITCIATTSAARGRGYALRLVEEVCRDLAGRGFAAVEAYPEARAGQDATPAASPRFWIRAGFRLAVDDERYPVVRREL
jgi:ribosomal protein S18 acetylase RimI-like enzyme